MKHTEISFVGPKKNAVRGFALGKREGNVEPKKFGASQA